MKKISETIICTIMFCLLVTGASAQSWYGSDGKVPLVMDSTKVNIKLVNGDSGIGDLNLLLSVEAIHGVLDDWSVFDGFVACTLARVPHPLGVG